jgi:hypothetical protein
VEGEYFNRLAKINLIDRGGAFLFAAMMKESACLLGTHDKKSIKSLFNLHSAKDIADFMRFRVITVEVAILELAKVRGEEAILSHLKNPTVACKTLARMVSSRRPIQVAEQAITQLERECRPMCWKRPVTAVAATPALLSADPAASEAPAVMD